jgi:hypothetical protein
MLYSNLSRERPKPAASTFNPKVAGLITARPHWSSL